MVAVAGSGIDKHCPHSVTLQPDTVAEGLFRSLRRKRRRNKFKWRADVLLVGRRKN
jgi:hypothetical protein